MSTNTTSPWDGRERRGQQWLPVRRVAKRSGYTGQYLTGLVRDGILVGMKGKRDWRLDPISVRQWWDDRIAKRRPDENKDGQEVERKDLGGNDEN